MSGNILILSTVGSLILISSACQYRARFHCAPDLTAWNAEDSENLDLSLTKSALVRHAATMVVLAAGVVTRSGKGTSRVDPLGASDGQQTTPGRNRSLEGQQAAPTRRIDLHTVASGLDGPWWNWLALRNERTYAETCRTHSHTKHVHLTRLFFTHTALFSRQFTDMSRVRIEGLLAAFPKLVSADRQHTYVETDSIRYLYQPLESMYLVLITNKGSNILEDLETLRLMGKVVTDFVLPLEEDYIAAAAFDLIFAFDEVVTLGGHKENITSGQVRQNIEMESHEEKLHKMIIQSKINETKDVMKKKAMEIERSKIEGGRRPGGPGMGGVSSGMGMGGYSSGSMGAGGMGMAGAGQMPSSYGQPQPAFGGASIDASSAPAPSSKPLRKGMKLGGGKPGGASLLASLKAEGEAVEDVSSAAVVASAPVEMPKEPVFVTIEEKMNVSLNKDGGLEAMDVSGSMTMLVNGDNKCVKVALTGTPSSSFQFKTHPNIDKNLFSGENVIGLKDPSREFPTSAALGVLKWRYQGALDESAVPLMISCWPSISGGESFINIEYECSAPFDLHDVQIVVPVPALSSPPKVNQIDGDYQYDARQSAFVWKNDLIDADNASGSAEFVVPATDPSAFFPIHVSFSATKTLAGLDIDRVMGATTGEDIKHGVKTSLVTENYLVE